MDFQRLFLFLIFSFSAMLLWDGWQRQQHPMPVVAVNAPVLNASTPAITPNPQSGVVATQSTQLTGQNISVKTDFLQAEISTVGGDLNHLELLQHHDGSDKSKNFVLLNKQAEHTYLVQTGLLGNDFPTHNSVFTAAAQSYQLANDKDSIEVRLTAVSVTGAKVAKVYVFHRGSYLVDVGYEIENTGNMPLSLSGYFQLVRDDSNPAGTSKFVPTYTGPAVYTELEKFQKMDFSSIEKNKAVMPKGVDNGWVGMLQHYFVSAWLPAGKTSRDFYVKKLDGNLYSAGVILPIAAIAAGQVGKINVPLYVGPAQNSLDKIAPGLGLTVDYGWLTIIATPMFWMLSLLQSWVLNWGVAIVLLTCFIKLLFFPLSAASYRSMAKMRVVAPKLEKLKKQYGDDREKLNRAMMDLYKTEKINPLGGCLPMLIQIPVFISLYWAILSSVELRYAPFFGWISDLSTADPYYILPLIMGASMLLQSKLNPVPADPLQAKLMQMMPIVFSVVFFFFPAGLVLYSIVNNALSIAQQWYITRTLEGEAKGVIKA
jgi:YidC/Oxa1 family membrane protein insertase